MRSGADGAFWCLLLLLAVAELLAQPAALRQVVADSDWLAAAEFVRARHRPGDLIVAAPAWTDPLVRWSIGDKIDLPDAGRSDLSRYRRLWSLSARGARAEEAPAAAPELRQRVGKVTVERWALPEPRVLYDFAEHLRAARVSMESRGGRHDCPWVRARAARGGGLGKDSLRPPEHFACDPKRPWLWVAPIVMEDLNLKPRYCVWQHPAGKRPVRVSFDDVLLGDALVLYGGLYYHHERKRRGGPVHVRLFVDDADVGRMIHQDGDGWKRLEVPLEAQVGRTHARIAIEVTAPRPYHRSFCWAASMRGQARSNAAAAGKRRGAEGLGE